MEHTSPLLLSLVVVAAGIVAAVLPFFFDWTHRTAHRWIAFGAGAILGAAFLHMIPEAYELSGTSSFGTLVLGFLTLYAIEQLSLRHPHEEHSGEFYEIGLLTFVGVAIHDLVDGIALGSGEHLPEITPAIFLALILHKIPTTFALSLLMLHGGYRKRTVLLCLACVLLMIPIGTLVSSALVEAFRSDHSRTIGRLINFSAGTFIYIGAYELLPEMHRSSSEDSRIGMFFLLGLALMFGVKMIHPVV